MDTMSVIFHFVFGTFFGKERIFFKNEFEMKERKI